MSIQTLNKCEAFNQMEWPQAGNFWQRCNYKYEGVILTETTLFPHNIFKSIESWTTIDYLLFEDDVKHIIRYGGEAVDGETYYAEEGTFIARFDNNENLVKFIDEYLLNKINQK